MTSMTSKPKKVLTEAPTTIIRVKDLIAKKDAEYTKDPAHDVCNGAQDPVTTRAGNSGSVRIRKLCNPTDKLSSAKKENTTAPGAPGYDSTHSIKMYMALKSRNVWRGTCARTRIGNR